MILLFLWACRPAPHDTGPEARDAPLAEVDVLVIGAGAGGLGAAAAAREAGATVALVERSSVVGGAARFATNHWAAGTAQQAAEGVDDSPDLALAEWAELTGGEPDDASVRAFVEGAAGTLAWLEGLGVGFTLAPTLSADTGSVRRLHTPDALHPVDAVGPGLAEHTRLDTTATGLVLDGPRVAGAEVDGPDGPGWIAAGAVVVATGGFTRNDALVAGYAPELAEAAPWYESHPGMDGNGLGLAQAAGATLAHMDEVGAYAHGVADANLGAPEVMILAAVQETLVVDALGRRVADERLFDSAAMGARYLDEGPFWAVYDDARWPLQRFEGRAYNYAADPAAAAVDGPGYEARVAVPRGDDLDALAGAAGLDADGLAATVAAYNLAAETGEDATFGKPAEYLHPVATPPFRAVPIVLARAKSWGGIATDARGAALDDAGTPIPGLFAAGEACGFLGTPAVGTGFNGSITAAWWSGRRAGAAAAE